MKISHLIGMTFSWSLLASPAFAQADEPQPQQQPQAAPEGQAQRMQRNEQQLEKLPHKARDTVKNQVGAGEIRSVEREQRDNRTVYQVEYRAEDGTAHELKVDQQGRLLEKEGAD